MKLIVGLGNPGEKYEKNRHNVGFMFVDYFLNDLIQQKTYTSEEFKKDKYLLSEIATVHGIQNTSHDFILAKPQTYMNKSGDAVRKLLERYPSSNQSLTTSHLIVVHDDLDIPLGKFKIQLQGPKLHNGLASIQDKLRTMDFLRIRIGVDNRVPENRMNGEEYVLQNFAGEERSQLPELFKKIKVRLESCLLSENSAIMQDNLV
ncbi:MAG: aminoacyl-tRNA hydrolase [bacterium]